MVTTIIDVDTHVTESPDLWTRHAQRHDGDQVPRIETSSDGRLCGSWGDPDVASRGLTATAGVGNFKNPQKLRRDAPGSVRRLRRG